MIERLRAVPTGEELAAMYAVPNDAGRWAEHELRVAATVMLGRQMFGRVAHLADLSAGTAGQVIARQLVEPGGRVSLADLAPMPWVHVGGREVRQWCGPIDDTLDELDDGDVDLFVCGETLEHVDDPGGLLDRVHAKAAGLLLSTPIDEAPGVNPEHVWRWDTAGVVELLTAAGWAVSAQLVLTVPVPGWGDYRCGIFAAVHQ